MNEKKELFGWSKLSTNDEKKYFTTLIVDSISGTTLEVHLPNSDRFKYPDRMDYAHCQMEDGSFWSCLDLVRTSMRVSMPGHTIIKYFAKWALKDVCCTAIDELKVHKAIVSFEGLQDWVNIYGFHDFELDGDNDSASIKYKMPEPILILDILREATAKLTFGFNVGILSKETFPLRQYLHLQLEFYEANRNLNDSVVYINTIVNFFDLIWGVHPLLTKLIIVLQDDNTGEFFHSEVYFQQRQAKRGVGEGMERKGLLSFKDLNPCFTSVFNKWISFSNRMGPVINILVEFNLQGGSLVTNTFLNLAQALETFHRKLRRNYLEPPNEFKRRIDFIMNSIPNEEHLFVKDKLMRANEPGLSQRIEDLLNEVPESVLEKIISNKDKFRKVIRDNRNYFTHYDEMYEDKGKVLPVWQVSILNEKIHMLLRILILKEIGIDLYMIEVPLCRDQSTLVALMPDYRNLF